MSSTTLITYRRCGFCQDSLLPAELETHFLSEHTDMVSALETTLATDVAGALAFMTAQSPSTTMGPIPAPVAPPKPPFSYDPFGAFEFTLGDLEVIQPTTSGSGWAYDAAEHKMLMETVAKVSGFSELNEAQFFVDLVHYLVATQGSSKAKSTGMVKLKSKPSSVAGMSAGSIQVQEREVLWSTIVAACSSALRGINREWHPREWGRYLYPAVYQARGSPAFAKLNSVGSHFTANLGIEPQYWYLCVSWFTGQAFTDNEKAILQRWCQTIIVDPESFAAEFDLTPSSIQAASAQAQLGSVLAAGAQARGRRTAGSTVP